MAAHPMDPISASSQPPAALPALTPADRRRTIWVLGALMTLTPFSIDLYLPAFPQLAAALNCSTARVALSLSSYFIAMALGQVFYGPLLDRFGRKPPIFAGLALYLVATVACLAAPSVEWLIALRFLQALGGCVAQVAAVAMVRDFFPPAEGARVFSLLMLILGVSPLLAPTAGGLIAVWLGWQWVFIVLVGIGSVIVGLVAWLLRGAQGPDHSVVLRPAPILLNFLEILREPRFWTYALAGACSFSGLFVYIAGSPIIFMEGFKVSATTYGVIFALLSIGFIGGNQVNIVALKHFSGERIFATALAAQVVVGTVFAVSAYQGWLGLSSTIALLFCLLGCLGFTSPNSSALALAPFTRNVGSASALLGFLQIGISALSSAAVGFFDVHTLAPIIAILAVMAAIGLAIFLLGRWRIAAADAPQAGGTTVAAAVEG